MEHERRRGLVEMLSVVDAQHELFAPRELGERLRARSQHRQRVVRADALGQHSGQRPQRYRRRTACRLYPQRRRTRLLRLGERRPREPRLADSARPGEHEADAAGGPVSPIVRNSRARPTSGGPASPIKGRAGRARPASASRDIDALDRPNRQVYPGRDFRIAESLAGEFDDVALARGQSTLIPSRPSIVGGSVPCPGTWSSRAREAARRAESWRPASRNVEAPWPAAVIA